MGKKAGKVRLKKSWSGKGHLMERKLIISKYKISDFLRFYILF